jgi:ribosomal protein S18 acetylase RimI-like enzyme
MSTLFNIRKATEKDFLALYDIERECFGGDMLSKRSMRNFINHNNHIFLVATHNKKIIGYVLTLVMSHHRLARHYSLAILVQYRRQSIGSQLLTAAESYIVTKQGVKLEVRCDNKAALNLYQSLGYKPGKTKSGYYEDGCDAMEMIKMLS